MRGGLKGRFCQPGAKPWDCEIVSGTALKAPLTVQPHEPALQAGNASVVRTPGVRPGLFEPALQAGMARVCPPAPLIRIALGGQPFEDKQNILVHFVYLVDHRLCS